MHIHYHTPPIIVPQILSTINCWHPLGSIQQLWDLLQIFCANRFCLFVPNRYQQRHYIFWSFICASIHPSIPKNFVIIMTSKSTEFHQTIITTGKDKLTRLSLEDQGHHQFKCENSEMGWLTWTK